MKGDAPGQGMKALNHRMTRFHPCEGCGDMLPPSSLRFCGACRKLLAKVLS